MTVSTWLTELDANAVSPARPGPLHAQLSALLRSRIADGQLPAGADLPTEAELQARFGVSRSVVRQALSTLTAEGLVRRGRGRGSVVAPRGEHHRLVQRLSGLSSQVPAVTTEVLALDRVHDDLAAAALGVGNDEVSALRRLRRAEGAPIALIHTWLPRRFGDDLTVAELTDTSLHAVLRARFGVTLLSGRRQVRAVAASVPLAAALEIDEGAPVLVLEGTTLDRTGVPIEMFTTWHRADRFVFDVDVVAGGPGDVEGAGEPGRSSSEPGPRSSGAVADARRAAERAVEGKGSAPTGDPVLAERARRLSRELSALADEIAHGVTTPSAD